nr:hypothetical protein [Tanacetum cinerariifolium]
MRTRSSSNLPVESPPNPSTSSPKCRNRRRSKQPFILENSPVDTMAINYQCLAADSNTFPELQDNIQGYVAAAAVNYNQGSGSLPSNTIANPKGKLKATTTRSGIVLDRPSVHISLLFINLKGDERVEETLTDQDLAEYTIKVPPPLV